MKEVNRQFVFSHLNGKIKKKRYEIHKKLQNDHLKYSISLYSHRTGKFQIWKYHLLLVDIPRKDFIH